MDHILLIVSFSAFNLEAGFELQKLYLIRNAQVAKFRPTSRHPHSRAVPFSRRRQSPSHCPLRRFTIESVDSS